MPTPENSEIKDPITYAQNSIDTLIRLCPKDEGQYPTYIYPHVATVTPGMDHKEVPKNSLVELLQKAKKLLAKWEYLPVSETRECKENPDLGFTGVAFSTGNPLESNNQSMIFYENEGVNIFEWTTYAPLGEEGRIANGVVFYQQGQSLSCVYRFETLKKLSVEEVATLGSKKFVEIQSIYEPENQTQLLPYTSGENTDSLNSALREIDYRG